MYFESSGTRLWSLNLYNCVAGDEDGNLCRYGIPSWVNGSDILFQGTQL